jgi:hypothetical protein
VTKRASAADFPIGCTVKVVRLPKNSCPSAAYLLGCIGTVVSKDRNGWVRCHFLELPDLQMQWADTVRPWWIERGRVEWIPELEAEVVK